MTSMNSQIKRVAAGVPTGGEFAAHDRAEGDVALLDDRQTFADTLRESFSDYYRSAALEDAISRELNRYEHHGLLGPDASGIFLALRDSRDWNPGLDVVAQHGWTGAELAEVIAAYPGHTSARMIRGGLKPDRIAELHEHGIRHPDAMLALHELDDDALIDMKAGLAAHPELRAWYGKSGHQQVAAHLRRGLRMDDIAEYAATGLTASDLTALHSPHLTAAAITDGVAATKLRADTVARLLNHNATSDSPFELAVAKTFGDRFRPEEVAALHGAGVPGSAAKSLRARLRALSDRHLAELHEAGVRTGAEAKAWEEITAPAAYGRGRSETAGALTKRIVAAASTGLTPAEAEACKKVGVDEPVNWVTIKNAGIDIDTWIKPGEEGLGRANTHIPYHQRKSMIIASMAEFKAAGGTPKLMRDMLRAGIPSHAHVAALGRDDLWEIGAPYRAEIISEYEYGHTARDWKWTKDTFTVDG